MVDSLKATLEEKNVILIDDFIPSSKMEWLLNEIKKSRGRFEREGYTGTKTIRDHKDPRGCGTRIITDERNLLRSIWRTNLWYEETMEVCNKYPIYKHARITGGVGDSTLLSVYYDGDYYGPHIDTDMECIVTCVLMLNFPEASFSGGNLKIEGTEIPFVHNRLIMFPSCLEHEVTKIENNSSDYFKQRFTLQHFISAVRLKKILLDESRNFQ